MAHLTYPPAMANALPNPSGDVFILNESILSDGKRASRESPRKRMIIPVQRNQDARSNGSSTFSNQAPTSAPTGTRSPTPQNQSAFLRGISKSSSFTPEERSRNDTTLPRSLRLSTSNPESGTG